MFLCRPAAAEHESSAAPLRVQLRFSLDWQLQVHLLKRKGPNLEGVIALDSLPGGLASIITPRLAKPSALMAGRSSPNEPSHAVGRPAPRTTAVRRVATH